MAGLQEASSWPSERPLPRQERSVHALRLLNTGQAVFSRKPLTIGGTTVSYGDYAYIAKVETDENNTYLFCERYNSEARESEIVHLIRAKIIGQHDSFLTYLHLNNGLMVVRSINSLAAVEKIEAFFRRIAEATSG